MTQFLKADTSVKVVIGPVVAVGDGFTPVTTLSLSTADEAEILKHDAAAVTDISGNTFAAITGADGYYNLTLTAAQLDTEGMLTVLANDDSLCLPVKKDFMVVSANVYDSLFAASGTDVLDVSVTQIGGDAQSATDLKDFADAGYDPATNKVQGVVLVDTTTTNTDMRGTNGAALASVCTEARLAELDAANIPADLDAVLVDTNSLNDTKIPDTISLANINAQVDAAWTTQMADSTVADGTIPTREQAMLFLTRFLTEFGISGTTLTVNKEDGTTAVATFTLDDATSPTSLTRAT